MSEAQTVPELRDADWWTLKGDEQAQTLGMVFHVVAEENAWRTDKDEFHWGLYDGTGAGGVTTSSTKGMTYVGATLPDNVCKMGVDTLTAKVATIRPIPQVAANRGNWKDQRRARKMRQLIEGEFYRQRIHEEKSAPIIKDALVGRAGVVQVFVEGKKPKVERVYSWTLFVDNWDAESGEPLSMFRLRPMDRRKCVAKFGKTTALKDKIKNAGRLAPEVTKDRDEQRRSTVDRIELVEAWHRCLDHDDDDEDHDCSGVHVIMCEGAVLFSEPWKKDYFPFAILTYDTPNTGYWGSGYVQTVEGYQVSINKANEKLDEMYELSGKYVILRDGSGIVNAQMTDGLHILGCKAGPYDPVVFDADLVNEHMRARPPELVERALNATGISQMAAQSQKPAGIDAAIALQTLDDIESQRHIVFGRRFEAWCLNVARLLIECVKDIAKKFGEYEVEVPLSGGYLPMKWSDVKIDGFQLQMQSVGQLYMSFAGKLDKLKTLFEMGAIDRGTFMRQLDAGDLQAELDLETADRLLVDEMLEAMLDSKHNVAANDNDDYISPNGYLPLSWAHKRAHQKRLKAEMEGAPPSVLDLLSRFIDDLDYLIAKAEGKTSDQALEAIGNSFAQQPGASAQPALGGSPAGGPMINPAGASPLAA